MTGYCGRTDGGFFSSSLFYFLFVLFLPPTPDLVFFSFLEIYSKDSELSVAHVSRTTDLKRS